jgi:hypothetical protein
MNTRTSGRRSCWWVIRIKDVDALYAEFAARGARLRHPPTNDPWGSRECQVADLAQHVLRIGSEAPPQAPVGEWLDCAGRRWRPEPDGGWRAAECVPPERHASRGSLGEGPGRLRSKVPLKLTESSAKPGVAVPSGSIQFAVNLVEASAVI